jgi:small GTP-binding protein
LQLKKKIVLLGDSAVGKTSLTRRYVFDQFEDSYISTIGTKATMKEMKIPQENEEIKITLMIWDLLGRDGYHALHARSFVGVNGAILVADLTRRETLISLERYWIPSLFKVVENVPMIFVSNKFDLSGQFEFEPDEMEIVAARYNIGYEEVLPKWLKTDYETSAKTGDNVQKVFESIGYMVLSQTEQLDPMKELYESLVAQKIKRTSDKTTPIGVLDAIIVDFCEGFQDSRLAMPILRQEIARAGMDIRSPFKEGIPKLVEYLAEAETEFYNEETVISNLKKRLKWVQGIVV